MGVLGRQCHEFQLYVGASATLGHKLQPLTPALRLSRHLRHSSNGLFLDSCGLMKRTASPCCIFWCVLAGVVMVLPHAVGQGFSDSVGQASLPPYFSDVSPKRRMLCGLVCPAGKSREQVGSTAPAQKFALC